MRALPILSFILIALFASPGWAVMQGQTVRDRDGLRASVVRVENSSGELCSGALVGADLVLTAAHCVTDAAKYQVFAVDRSFRTRSYRAIAAAVHPAFVPGTTPRTQPGVDLAILKLDRPVTVDFIPLDLRGTGRVQSGDTVLLAGFGVIAENQKRSARTLRQTSLVALGSMQVMNRVLVVADSRRLGETAGAGACRGDSGGPILAPSPSGYRLVGIVSWSSGALSARQTSACGGLTAVTPIADHVRWVVEGVDALNQFTSGLLAESRNERPVRYMSR
jgi:secreted trypsin-like serine protease